MCTALKWADVNLTNVNSPKQLTNVAAQKPGALTPVKPNLGQGSRLRLGTLVLAEALSSRPSTHYGQLTIPHITPAPEDRRPSSGLCEHMHSHAQTLHTTKNKNKSFYFLNPIVTQTDFIAIHLFQVLGRFCLTVQKPVAKRSIPRAVPSQLHKQGQKSHHL